MGSRIFENATVTWTQSTTGATVQVTVTIGAAEAARLVFDPVTLVRSFSNSGNGYETRGTFHVTYGPGGITGELHWREWTWTVNDVALQYRGFIGNW